MGRDDEEERAIRQRRAGRWLRTERDDRRLKQAAVADRLGVSQQMLSLYERGLAKIPEDLAPRIAEVFELDVVLVWRALEMKLPPPFRTDDEVIAWAWRTHPEAMEKATGLKPPPDANKRPRATRPGEKSRRTSRRDENAI